MHLIFNRNVALFALAALAAPEAWAHPGHGATGFFAGLAHPLAGVDHLLALLALGAYVAGMLLASIVLQRVGLRLGLALRERFLPWIGTAIAAWGALALAYS